MEVALDQKLRLLDWSPRRATTERITFIITATHIWASEQVYHARCRQKQEGQGEAHACPDNLDP